MPAAQEARLKPRNPRQVKNAQSAVRRVQRYTQDDLFNLVELAYDLKDFVHHLFLVPELGVVLAHRAILQQTDRESNIAKMNGNEQIGADEMEGDDIVDENEKDEQDKGTTPTILPSSQVARAQMIVDNNKCIYQPEMKVFTVQGTCDVHAVKLFPKQSCTCPAKSECYHILSAKLYMGMDLGKKQKKITMTQLRRNTRPRTNRKKGRKGPLTEDEVEPAPDARVNQTQADSNPISAVQPPPTSAVQSPPTSAVQPPPNSAFKPPSTSAVQSPPTSAVQGIPVQEDSTPVQKDSIPLPEDSIPVPEVDNGEFMARA